MSKEVEQRVVEMRFDNKQFESATATTMSTLDKLKQKLNFTGSAKGLNDVGTAARQTERNMSPLANAVQTVQARFSSLQVIGVTALANITNSAVNAGKRIVSAFTIDPVKTGFQEYETQINAIQTILANTQSKGSTLDDVTRALDELNKYADQTIYNFTEMTRNIGTFTAAGVDLDKSVTSIKGIANLAAVSGSNAQQASTAMYQLSQAIASGTVTLMDWNSVVNAGMGGEVFQTALKRTATQMGYNVDALIEKYGSFRNSLTEGQWLTTEVLTETLTQLSGAYSEADLIAQGYSEKQAKEIVQLAETAVGAATDVKTFTQLMDTLKESVQSGWTQTWEILIGDFEEAKALWTEVSDIFGGIIQSSADARNALLEGALGDSSSKWENLTEKINACGISTEQFEARLKEVAIASGMTEKEFDSIISKNGSLAKAFEKGALPIKLIVDTIKSFSSNLDAATKPVQVATDQLEYFNKVVGKVIRGDFGNGEERIKALTAAGYDNVAVQKLVNKIWERNGKTWDNVTLTSEELTEVIGALSSKELQNIGYTKEQADALKDLAKQAEETGTPINELIESLNKPSGRELLIDSFRNALQGLIKVCGAVGEAWRDAFPPMTSDQLYSIIEGIHSFSEVLNPSAETVDKLTRSLKGLFAVIDIITTVVGGGFKFAFKLLEQVLGAFDMDILDLTANLGDAAVKLRDFIENNEFVTKGIEAAASGIASAVKAIQGWVDTFLQLPAVQTAIENFKDALSDLSNIGQWAIEGLQNGFKDGLTSIPKLLMDIGTRILEAIKGVLGIHSPSTEMYNVGKFTIEGLVNGIKDGVTTLLSALKWVADQCINLLSNIPWDKLISAGLTIDFIYVAKQATDAVSAIAAPFEGLGDLLSGVGQVLDESAKSISKTIKSFSKVLNAKAFSMRADAIKTLAISIAILAGSLFLVSKIDSDKLLGSVAAIAALAAVMGALAVTMGKFGPEKVASFGGFSLAVIGLSASILLMASALNKLNSLDPDKYAQTLGAFAAIVAAMVGIIAAYGKLVTPQASANIAKVGTMMLSLSASLLLMVGVIKLISGMDANELVKGGVAITAFVGIVGLLVQITKIGKEQQMVKLGSTLIAMSAAMLTMVAVIKLISGMSAGELIKGGLAITAFVGIVGLLVQITKVGKEQQIAKLSGILLSISASMLIMVGVTKLISGMSAAELIKGGAAITAFVGIVALLVQVTKVGSDTEIAKASASILATFVAVGILAAIAVVLSMVDLAGLAKGIVAVGFLSAIMAGLMVATKYAQDIKGILIVISVAIGILALAVAGLSFIEPSKLVGPTLALSALMGMFAVILKSSANVNASLGTLITMSVVIGLLGGIVYALSTLPVESVLNTTASLSILLLSLSASLKILSTVLQKVSASALLAMGALTLAVGGIAGIMILLEKLNVQPSIETATALSILLTAMAGVTAILSAVGKIGAGAALQGALALDGVIVVIGGLMAGIGALVTYFPQLEEFVNKGIGLLEAVGKGIGSFFGNIVGGFISGVTDGFPDIATNLSKFMENLQPFIAGAKSIDEETANSVGALAKMILALTAAELLDGISSLFSFFTGSGGLEGLGEKLIPFGEDLAEFGRIIKGQFDPESTEAAANAGLMLARLNETIPKQGGILQNFLGTQDLGQFGEQLKKFGVAIADFGQTVKGKIDATSVEAAANAGMALAELANNIPKQDGILQDFLGERDLGKFGEQLKKFGEAIAAFSKTVSGNIDAGAVEAAANAGKMLADLATTIPKQDGILQDFFGEQDLGKFGSQLKTFGEAIVGFSKIVAGNIDPAAVEAAANAGKALAELNSALPKQDGIFQNIFGEQDLGKFGEQLVSFGKNFATYSNYMKGVDAKIVTTTANAAASLVELQKSIPSNAIFTDETWLDEFGAQISEFGRHFSNYYNYISGIDVSKLSNVITQANRLVEMAKGMTSLDTSGMSKFGSSLEQFGNKGVEAFINAFDNATLRVTMAANNMVVDFANGIESNQYKVTNQIDKLLEKLLKSIDSKYSEFQNAGRYMVDGFAKGIQDNTSKAVAQARSMANAARKETEGVLGIHSPSTVFLAIGGFVVQGFANGVKERMPEAEEASKELGTRTIGAFNETLDINEGPSQVLEGSGHYVVQGIAQGITEDMSAEEAAKQKAQNIANAFADALSDIDLSDTTGDLEYQLWGALNPNASQDELNAKETADIERQIMSQAKRVNLANAQYIATDEQFGENSIEAREAYNNLLQEQITLAELGTKLNEAQKAEAEANNEAYQRYLEEAQKERDFLLSLGYTAEEIDRAAAQRAGYDPTKPTQYKEIDVKKLVDDAVNGVTVSFEDGLEDTATKVVVESTNLGETMATAIGSGVQNGAPAVTENVSGMLTNCTNKIDEDKPKWKIGGGNLVDAFIVGIAGNVERAAQAAANMARTVYQAAMDAINVPAENQQVIISQKVTETGNKTGSSLGSSILSGVVNAIKNASDLLMDAIDSDPTITPVVDISSAMDSIGSLNTAFSELQAASVSNSINSSKKSASASDTDAGSGSSGATYQFTQNNYSPKALSRIDIYRQTKNQFSAFGRVVKA